ncbi:MAG: two-component system, chemotaxis family, CheB/CheR fusion protein [Methyloprofundus sp.]|nr:MAG: two-component system, chemotaxis family, CheB/CheR fusion protein [Methyloprofundus sp.]
MKTAKGVIFANLLLTIVYYFAAQLTLTLSLPPSGATPIWAPSGIALGAILIWGYRLLPAVFFGDFLVAVGLVGLQDITAISLCSIIGIQAVFHSWHGKCLLVYFKLWPTALITDRDIIKFFGIAGILTTLTTALLTVALELSIGVLNSESWLDFFITWWVGGALGVVVFTPIMLILFARPRSVWVRRKQVVVLPMMALFLCLIVVLHFARDIEGQQKKQRFVTHVELIHTLIKHELEVHETLLKSMAVYFKDSQQVSQLEFDRYVAEFSHYQDDIYAVAWMEFVPDAQRLVYEQQYGNIVELGQDRINVIRAKQRGYYFVVKYAQVPQEYSASLKGRKNMLNFNMCYTPERSKLCKKLLNSQVAVLMPPIMQEIKPGISKRFAALLPARSTNDVVVGVAAHMYDYQNLFGQLLTTFKQQWLYLEIKDITSPTSPNVLFTSTYDKRKQWLSQQALVVQKTIYVGDQQWQFSYRPTSIFVEQYSSWMFYWLIAGALLVLSMVGVFLLALTGREQLVRQEVQDKTKEIHDKSQLLLVSEHKYRHLVEGVQHDYLIFAHDINGVFTYISPSVETILGYGSDEWLQHYSNFMPDTELNRLVDTYTLRTLSGETVPPYELEVFDKQGKVHTLRITERMTKDMEGACIGVEGIAQDITDLKASQIQLKKLSLAVAHSPNAVVITDQEGIIEYVNPKFIEMSGYQQTEIEGKWPSVISSGNTPASVYEELWCTLLAGNEWQGELQNVKKNGELYWAREHICPMFDDAGKVTHFVATQEDITEAKRLQAETSFQVSHDSLTGLINRREFEQRLARVINSAKQENSNHALCFLDLDQFKVVNDTCGHVAGDELLRQVASVMQKNIRVRDTLARLGGDEFAILMEHCNTDKAYAAAEHVIHALEDFRFHYQDNTFALGVSIGLAVIDKHTKDSQEVLSQVDSACYAAKDAGRNRIEIHIEDSERLKQRKGEVKWNIEINDALDEGRFLLYVQPIVPIANPSLSLSYEVLLRMQMRDGTVAPPGAFLPAAERYNSIVRIDRWVVSHTLQWLALHADNLQNINAIAINLSGASLGDEAMLAYIVQQLVDGDVPAEKIKFEITETAAIANLHDATVFMQTLSELGCRFALDDFGSGLSSFAYLKNLQVDLLKIDGMFVKDMLDDPIDFEMVKSINQIGHVMGLETIAEFVENEQILDKLREIGIDYAQGYHLGKPQPIASLLESKAIRKI